MSDEFDTDLGVKDDYVGTILVAQFQIGDSGDCSLVLRKKAEDGDEPEDYYRVGTDWSTFDGGQTVEHPSKHNVRADSQLATLTARAMACGAEAVIRERSSANGSLGYRTAAIWPALRFHWTVESKEVKFTRQDTGEKIERNVVKSYPDQFLGIDESLSTESTGSSTPEAIPAEVAAKLKILAQSKPFSDWVDEALQIDWVRDNMLSALGDESFYNSLKE